VGGSLEVRLTVASRRAAAGWLWLLLRLVSVLALAFTGCDAAVVEWAQWLFLTRLRWNRRCRSSPASLSRRALSEGDSFSVR